MSRLMRRSRRSLMRVVLVQEVIDQPGNVLAAIAQRRQVDAHHVEPIKQILAEVALGDFFLQIDVGGGDHAHVHLHRLRIADALEFALLQDAQQFHLQLRLQRADLIEENRAAVGGLKPADLVADGAGERSLDVAEQFAIPAACRSARRS